VAERRAKDSVRIIFFSPCFGADIQFPFPVPAHQTQHADLPFHVGAWSEVPSILTGRFVVAHFHRHSPRAAQPARSAVWVGNLSRMVK
jgi:hypothetical protein